MRNERDRAAPVPSELSKKPKFRCSRSLGAKSTISVGGGRSALSISGFMGDDELNHPIQIALDLQRCCVATKCIDRALNDRLRQKRSYHPGRFDPTRSVSSQKARVDFRQRS
jgi:hypothetical protein